MAIQLDIEPKERSTLVLTVSWYDETDTAVTPTAATWSLTDTDGNVVNGRSAVATWLEALATVNHAVLSNADLAVLATAPDDRRVFTVQATYNSSNGSGLTLTEAAMFSLEDLVAVS